MENVCDFHFCLRFRRNSGKKSKLKPNKITLQIEPVLVNIRLPKKPFIKAYNIRKYNFRALHVQILAPPEWVCSLWFQTLGALRPAGGLAYSIVYLRHNYFVQPPKKSWLKKNL